RVGGGETQVADVRILATSTQDLEQLMEHQRFRKDLYFRLRGFTIALPSLRDRSQDIAELAHYFLFRKNRQLGTAVTSISEESLERMQQYNWPGNVRELQNAIRESLIRSSGPVLIPEFLPPEVLRQPVPDESSEDDSNVIATWESLAREVDAGLMSQERGLYRRALRQFDRIVVSGAMKRTNGNQASAAELLGLSRPTLRGKIRSMKRDFPDQDRLD
ncbi:MAG: sigma 54-interacting transcriptional regulator, partial [Planctomycetota bacterium]|nr:sigma 54-interacting transcriptional regulator [Planctomycetota bacterium]